METFLSLIGRNDKYHKRLLQPIVTLLFLEYGLHKGCIHSFKVLLNYHDPMDSATKNYRLKNINIADKLKNLRKTIMIA